MLTRALHSYCAHHSVDKAADVVVRATGLANHIERDPFLRLAQDGDLVSRGEGCATVGAHQREGKTGRLARLHDDDQHHISIFISRSHLHCIVLEREHTNLLVLLCESCDFMPKNSPRSNLNRATPSPSSSPQSTPTKSNSNALLHEVAETPYHRRLKSILLDIRRAKRSWNDTVLRFERCDLCAAIA